MTALLTLTDYPEAGAADARLILVPQSYAGLVQILDSTDADVTAYLIAQNILRWNLTQSHGWIASVDAAIAFLAQTDAALNWNVAETYYAMSSNFNAGETPIFFARVVNSLTQTPLTTADVSSIALTIFSYSSNNIRSSVGTGYVPIDNWEDVALTVADVIDDSPSEDPRVSFVPNLVFEPDTLTDNPFDNPGQYRATFTITPVAGNKIPVCIDFRIN